jgi:hypothetical protein
MASISLTAWLGMRVRKPQLSRRGRCWPEHPAKPRFVPRLECLEGRVVPSTLTVTNAFDSGPGCLRAALGAANDCRPFDPFCKQKTLTRLSSFSSPRCVV